ncbi:MAG: hypothetical protein KDD40_01150 [Bdellovibrionales bacterium]|nr:hypothetical protein [Bdellovibrionales bacterium]
MFKQKRKDKQLEFTIRRPKEKDRNFQQGGRSFYFFDFDDNIAVLGTPTYLYHIDSGEELIVSSGEFAENQIGIGKFGRFKNYKILLDDENGSFRNFRDRDLTALEKLFGKKQFFIEDLIHALGCPEQKWKGPSWNCFYHAIYNGRPISLITARGHSPKTIRRGIKQFVKEGFLPSHPNYLSIYPVSHPSTRKRLTIHAEASVAELKKIAIRKSVEKAFLKYGQNPFHRFGMSDDDPKNIHLIIEEMTLLKQEYPQNSFFVFDTYRGQFIRREGFFRSYRRKSYGPGPSIGSSFGLSLSSRCKRYII